jgi:CBS-domain-containing membrane protein
MDWGGWMWFVIDVLAVVILGVALAYGAAMWRHRPRNPQIERASDEATKDLYHHPR